MNDQLKDNIHHGINDRALAQLLAADGKYTEALAHFRAANDALRAGMAQPYVEFSRHSNYSVSEHGIVNCLDKLAKTGHVDTARQICEELSQPKGSGAELILLQMLAAEAWDAIGSVDESSVLFDKIVQECRDQEQRHPGPLDLDARASLARVIFEVGDREFQRGKNARALILLDLALQSDPNQPMIHDRRAQIFLACGENEKALADLNAAILQGQIDTVFRHRALAHFRLAQYSQALADLTQSQHMDSVIDPNEVAACSDVDFRRNYSAWFNAMFAASPNSEAHLNRAALLAALGEQELKPADLATIQLDLDTIITDASVSHTLRNQAALVAVKINELDRYRQICRKMLAAFANTQNADEAAFAAWTCALIPDALADYGPAISLARHSLALQPMEQSNLVWLGAILYRAGKYEEVISQLAGAEDVSSDGAASPAYRSCFRAMAHHRLGQADEAQKWLEQGISESQAELTGAGAPPTWRRRLMLQRLVEEARQLIQP